MVAAAFTLAPSRAGEWLGYPKGAWLIIGVEFWERFSFYGMLSILVLFLTATPIHGGFGWSATEALALLGAYSFAMYAFPALGGFFADRVLGRRRAVTWGATFMLIGQVMLTSPVFLPALLAWWHGAPLLKGLHDLGMPLGRIQHSPALDAIASIIIDLPRPRDLSLPGFISLRRQLLNAIGVTDQLAKSTGEDMQTTAESSVLARSIALA